MSWEVRTSEKWPQIVRATWSEDKERGVSAGLALGARRLAFCVGRWALGVGRSSVAATVPLGQTGSAGKKGSNRSEWLDRSQRAVAIPFERTTMWRLRFVIVPDYSRRPGFLTG